ncbi:MAG TPA: hypothetical protein VFS77_06835 [Pyrinomonadaceae bacterium]|nr:hypothetical protein [Pyrinomonadaceae bacterium]
MKTLIILAITFLFPQIVVVAQKHDGNHRRHVAAPTKAATKAAENPPEKPAEKSATPSSATVAAFEKLKSLVGEWEARDGVSYGGKPIRINYKIVSQGSGVMETYTQVGSDLIEMVTVYHLDGDKLVATHFCAVNNQVRLRAEPAVEGVKELRLSYVDASNLSVSNKEVMKDLVITFQDKDHFTQAWTWRMTNDKGKTKDDKAVYNFVRRK